MAAGGAFDPLRYERIALGAVELDVAIANRGGRRGLALLVHGFPESALSWRYQIDPLVDAGYEVWAPNTRGYVGSTKPRRIRDYSIEELVGDLDALITRSGHDRITLVGHDWGALQAWVFAMRGRHRLERLVVMNGPHPACLARELRRFHQMRRSWYIAVCQIPWLPERLLTAHDGAALTKMFADGPVGDRVPSAVVDLYRDGWLRPGAMTAMINYYRAVGGAWRQLRAGFPTIDVPTLMIWGLDDVALSRETTDGTDDYVADLTIRYLPGVGHQVQQHAPEAVNAMMISWLDGDDPPHADEITAERLADPALQPR